MRLALGLIATSMVFGSVIAIAACGSFSGTSTPDVTSDAGTNDATAKDAGSAVDGAIDAAIDGGQVCLDLSKGNYSQDHPGETAMDAGVVGILYPASSAGAVTAFWEYSVATPENAAGATLDITCEISTTAQSGDWYAAVAGILNGESGSSDYVVLAGAQSGGPTLDLDTFLMGTADPTANTFITDTSSIITGKTPQKLTLDVTWTTTSSGSPVTASIAGISGSQSFPGPTLASQEGISGTTIVRLGDSASSGQDPLPAVQLTFTKACVTFH